MVRKRILFYGGEDRQRQRDQQADQHRPQSQLNRIAQCFADFSRHAHSVLVGFPQIAAQDFQRPVAVLREKRAVETHVGADFFQYLFRDGDALRVELFRCRVAGSQIHQQKGEKAQRDQDPHQMQHPFGDILSHKSTTHSQRII